MKRSEFLKRLGIGAVVAITTPVALTSMPAKKNRILYPIDTDLLPIRESKLREHMTSQEYHLDNCRRIKLLDKKEKEIADITLPKEFCIRFWDVITHKRGADYVVCRRMPSSKHPYWIAIEA